MLSFSGAIMVRGTMFNGNVLLRLSVVGLPCDTSHRRAGITQTRRLLSSSINTSPSLPPSLPLSLPPPSPLSSLSVSSQVNWSTPAASHLLTLVLNVSSASALLHHHATLLQHPPFSHRPVRSLGTSYWCRKDQVFSSHFKPSWIIPIICEVLEENCSKVFLNPNKMWSTLIYT